MRMFAVAATCRHAVETIGKIKYHVSGRRSNNAASESEVAQLRNVMWARPRCSAVKLRQAGTHSSQDRASKGCGERTCRVLSATTSAWGPQAEVSDSASGQSIIWEASRINS